MLFSPHTYPSMHWGLFIRNKKKESLICVRFRQRAPPTHSHTHTHTDIHTPTHTHICVPAEQGAVPLLDFHISKSLGCFGTAGVVVLFYKRQTSKELGMRSRAPSTQCWNGDLALWHIWSTRVRKLRCFFPFPSFVSCLSSAYSHAGHILY